jgi:hypothetical protein
MIVEKYCRGSSNAARYVAGGRWRRLALLITEQDHRPGDRQQGQCGYGYCDTPDTGLAYCRF